MIYIICFIFSTIFTFIAEKTFKKNQKIVGIFFSIFAILIPCILAGLRDVSVGTDVKVYVESMFKNALSFNNLMNYINANNEYTENGYLAFTYLISRFTNNIHIFLFIIQLVIMIPTYIAFYYRRDKAPMWLSMIVYFGLYYNYTLNLVRQSMAMAFIFLSYIFFSNKKYIKTLLLFFIALMLHKSAFLAIPTYLILYLYAMKKISKRKKFVIIAISLIITFLITIFYEKIATFLYNSNILPYKYYAYVVSDRFRNNSIDINYFDFIYKTLWIILYIILYLTNNKEEKRRIVEDTIPYFVFIMIDYIIFPISFSIVTLIRVGYYYGLNIFPILIPNYIKIFKKDKVNQILGKLLLVVLVSIYWIYSIMINHGMGTYPYILG